MTGTDIPTPQSSVYTPAAEPAPQPAVTVGTVTYHPTLIQGGDEWLQARLGLLTASEMKLLITPTLKIAANDKQRAHFYELLAQRISSHVEPHYVGDDMLRGLEEEGDARNAYAEHHAPVQQCGFITNDRWGFVLGYSPDGMVGDLGLIEVKSRRQKYQVQTILEHLREGTIPVDYVMQIQTGLLVSEREWCDFISYSGGLPMVVIRVYPDPVIHDAIVEAAEQFETAMAEKLAEYEELSAGLIPTERRVEQEMIL